MKYSNKGFTVMEVTITIFIMAMISIPLYFLLSDSSRQVNITAARDYIKQESNKVYKILENDLTQAKLGSFSQSNNEFSIKIRTRASEKAEDNLLTLNSRVVNIQKESKDSIIKIEKMLEENLKYPGIIGRNSKFSNFRFFVDFVMNNIKSLNDFKDEIQNFV